MNVYESVYGIYTRIPSRNVYLPQVSGESNDDTSCVRETSSKVARHPPPSFAPLSPIITRESFSPSSHRISRISIGSIRVAARIFYSDTFASRLEALSRVDIIAWQWSGTRVAEQVRGHGKTRWMPWMFPYRVTTRSTLPPG